MYLVGTYLLGKSKNVHVKGLRGYSPAFSSRLYQQKYTRYPSFSSFPN